MNILEGLNDKQYEAVINTEGPNLIIAGAGSGKTKVLTHKIAYLIGEKNVKPWQILAITFTNKAANEMKTRVEALVGEAANEMWLGTFHSICVRILRRFIDRLGYESSFIIFDTSDQRSLVKQCLRELNIDDKLFTDRSVLSEISNAKNEMLTPESYKLRTNGEYRKEKIAEIYAVYQRKLKENNAIDFDDIINFTIDILTENPDVLEYYSDKFKYVLVDEYQDTNKSQFTLLTLIAARHGNITAVGDNDQGIYSFRGADISNILNFEKDFPGTKIIKLDNLVVKISFIENKQIKYVPTLFSLMPPDDDVDVSTLPPKSDAFIRKLAKYDAQLKESREVVLDLVKCGKTLIGLGSDIVGIYPNHDGWREFKAWIDLGVSPLHTMRAATSVNAMIVGRPDLGMLVPGKTADVVAWHRDLLTDNKAASECSFVMKEGNIFKNV